MNRFIICIATVGTLVGCMLAGCASPPVAADNGYDRLRASLAQPDRSEQDRARDATRRPADVLAFFSIEPDDVVLDLYSGGGYYTEVLSYAVGKGGTVHAHNNRAYLAYADKELESRFTAGRLKNVRRFTAENNALNLAPDTYDATLMILTYHDIYFVDAKNGWPRLDGEKLLAEIYSGLKSGGVLGVIDHAALDGAPAEVGGTLHRIDPERVVREVTAAGFVLEAKSDMLANPNDERTQPMFDEAVKGKTDRFVFRFRKP